MTIMIPTWVNGELTPVEKLEAHEKGLRHKAVSVFVMQGDKTLIQQRAMCKYHTPGLWANTCCTHPEFNEDPIACAVRRLDEELGITGLTPVYRDTVEYRADVGNGLVEHEVVDIFTAQAPTDLIVRPNPEEVMAVDWVELPDLEARLDLEPDVFTPWVRIYMQDFADRIFG
ncbi:MAG: isopentenyl-diphosphate Delta-isomerase [Pseudomonadota bacterium]